MKTSTVLKKALNLFGKTGARWIKGATAGRPRFGNKNLDAFCSIGAINAINIFGPCGASAEAYLSEAIGHRYSSDAFNIIAFNDDKETRFRSVARKFRKAIRLAERAGD